MENMSIINRTGGQLELLSGIIRGNEIIYIFI
jgi:hypothetical protein